MKIVAICVFLMLSSQAGAAGLVINDAKLRSDLTWLSDRAVIHLSLSTWPMSQEEIERALKNATGKSNSDNQQVIARVQQRLVQLKAPVRLSGWTTSAESKLPATFGASKSAAHSFGVAATSSGDFWDINLQGQVEGNQYIKDTSQTNFNNAYAGVQLFNQWLAFGEIPQWWGPGNDGSTIRSDAARPVVGFILQRAEQSPFESAWLSWLGNWQYQLSAGQLRQYQRPEEPKVIGGRVTIMPFSALELGASRMLLWGGKGRPNNLASFDDALLGHDNTGSQNRDPGDQLGGVDFRLKLAPLIGLPLSLYGQVTGEDQAGVLPSHNTFIGGLEGHHALGEQQLNWYLEAADTRSGLKDTGITYSHYCYHDGYYQQGYPLGEAMGGDGTKYSTKMEWVLQNQQRLSTRLVWVRVNRKSQNFNQAYPQSDTIKGIQLGWELPVLTQTTLGTQVWYNASDNTALNETGVSLSFLMPIWFN
ncbi:capsule assembly Wzi family protein [Buttiauxella sp. B2]|uniref:capsule assembly Wzi family protein n=1 Tax=Buttiauxella sp. B2 TaxID=2587812 RepID=UPI00112344F2|nr:capsule assembly Wzi family protein [Buttiauxella sp. B2]TNV11207.1 capsule assembly Wzi family protein [Buttiauxella sp. B2]